MPDVVLAWELQTRADLASTWALFSDTDRFNRVAGVGLHFEIEPAGDEIRRLGWSRRLGMRIDWEELPFEYEAPAWFVSTRKFSGGPARRLEARLELSPNAEGTRIAYRILLTPRNGLVWPVIAADANLSVKPQLDRALRKAIAVLDDPEAVYDPPPPPLSPEAGARLESALEAVNPPALRAELSRALHHDPLFRQQRLAPLAIAARLGLDPDAVLGGFLAAVRSGALSLRWELLCPRCQGPKRVLDQLDPTPGEAHCPTCNIRYDGSFPDSVVVRFEPAPAIRAIDVPIECLLAPARTPHIVANRRIEAGGTAQLRIDLEPGGYLLRTDPPTATASLEVRAGVRSTAISIDLESDGLFPALLRVGAGTVELHLRSRSDRDLHLSIERRSRPDWALTAGRLLELPGARELLPPGALAPGLQSSTVAQAVLCVDTLRSDPEVLAKVQAMIDQRAPQISHRSDDRFLATWDHPAGALDAAESLDADPRLALGLAWGPVVALTQGTVTTPAGGAVEAAVAAARAAGGGRTVLADAEPGRWTGDPARVQVGPDGLMAFALSRVKRTQALFEVGPPDPPPPPDRIGPWTVGPELGAGGFGVVHRASGPEGDAVVKLLHTDKAHDPEHAQQFFNEARITASLSHPNTVRVYDWGHTRDGRLYLALEYLDGHELAADLEAGRVLSPKRACKVAIQALGSLQEAHDAGVVHRDIKPQNLIVCSAGVVKLIDFGIAREVDSELPLAERGTVLGTPEWLSPEQVDLEPLDGRSDVYAVGLLLYRAVSGRLPFEGNNPMVVAMQRVAIPAPPLSSVTEQPLPDGFEAVVMRALATDPDDRWPSASELRLALVQILRA